jgi:two-component system chemotaxis response regulator CheY
MKLLIVDDSLMMRKSVERALAEKHFTLAGSAADGEEALRVFRETLPDLVTLDISMPKMDGLTCLTEMLKLKPDAKILIVSSQTDTATVKDALLKGAAGVVGKPFSADHLLNQVNAVLGR